MDFNSDGVSRLEEFFGLIGNALGSDKRRASFASYAMGMFSDAERKSVEPLAALLTIDPADVDAEHQRMLHFIRNSRWSDLKVRLESARYALKSMTARERINVWIVDDTGFLKQGKHSVGVQRQYTGSAGKVTNCQVGVSLSVATPTEHLPIDFELYIPESWADDSARCKKALIPDGVKFLTKPELALQMIRRALAADISRGVFLADAGYGTSSDFRAELRSLGLEYAVAVNSSTKVQLLNNSGKPVGKRRSVAAIAKQLKNDFRPHVWRRGTRGALKANFLKHRVQVSEHEFATLLIEWRDGEPTPANSFLISMKKVPAMPQLLRIVMQRWRTERAYQDLKGELGLDHFEGRSFPGWHHHVSVVLSCYAFIIAERSRRFFSATARTLAHYPLTLTPSSSLRGQLRHHASCDCLIHQHMAPEMPLLPPPTSASVQPPRVTQ